MTKEILVFLACISVAAAISFVAGALLTINKLDERDVADYE